MKPAPQISIVVSFIQLRRRSSSCHRPRPPPADWSIDGMLFRLSKQNALPLLTESYRPEDFESNWCGKSSSEATGTSKMIGEWSIVGGKRRMAYIYSRWNFVRFASNWLSQNLFWLYDNLVNALVTSLVYWNNFHLQIIRKFDMNANMWNLEDVSMWNINIVVQDI